MSVLHPHRFLTATLATAAALSLAACGATQSTTQETGATMNEPEQSAASTDVTVEDNHGTHTVSGPFESIVATDNRIFETLEEWGIELAAAPQDIMAPSSSYRDNAGIVNLGNHREPNLEAIVAVQPDLILNGQRFAAHYGDIAGLAPEATILEFDPRDGQPFDEELRRQITALGEVLGHEEDAQALVSEFDASIERAATAYDEGETVMAVITSGGTINYASPGTGRTLGPVYDILGLTPALTADGSTEHQGDDISVEAIAQANPDWLLVMDRDAAISQNPGAEEEYVPANELITESAALQNVTAVQEGNIVYMPQETYVNESIQAYTTFFNSIADALEAR